MFRILFLVFIIVPIIEIAVLMQVGELIGGWPTVGVVILTAWLGAVFVRQQGIATVQNLQTKMAQGQAPSEEIVAGLLLLVAGVFLVTPGFVTDAFGLSLLIPQVRKGLVKGVQRHIVTSATSGANFSAHQHSSFEQQNPFEAHNTPKAEHQGKTIDGEFERKE
ncbi:FxsA family protein [Thalassotalea atypica]|uniref:FxsA family protein n=1 Tax=Thalassotalea atypica TaxID=2054316 RepID=UPI002573BDD3|nr:FxsA family protein [Thalassotalea atypica]